MVLVRHFDLEKKVLKTFEDDDHALSHFFASLYWHSSVLPIAFTGVRQFVAISLLFDSIVLFLVTFPRRLVRNSPPRIRNVRSP